MVRLSSDGNESPNFFHFFIELKMENSSPSLGMISFFNCKELRPVSNVAGAAEAGSNWKI